MNRIVAIFALFMLSVLILSCTVGAQRPEGKAKQLAPGDHSLALQVGDLERRYILHVPQGYDGKKPVPVVIMFHGGGGTGQGAMRETGWAQKADNEGFLAVFPNATPPDPTQISRFRTNGQIWNDGSGRFHAGKKNIPDVAFTEVLLTVIKDHGHVWPGGKNLLPESLVGKTSDKFKATDAIWEFFKRHALQEPR